VIESTSRNESLLNFFIRHSHMNVPVFVYLKNNILIVCIYTRLRLNVILNYLLMEGRSYLTKTNLLYLDEQK